MTCDTSCIFSHDMKIIVVVVGYWSNTLKFDHFMLFQSSLSIYARLRKTDLLAIADKYTWQFIIISLKANQYETIHVNSTNWRLDCLLNRLSRRRSNKTSKLGVTCLCEGNPPVTGGFPSQGPVTRKCPFDDVIMILTSNYRGFVCLDVSTNWITR